MLDVKWRVKHLSPSWVVIIPTNTTFCINLFKLLLQASKRKLYILYSGIYWVEPSSLYTKIIKNFFLSLSANEKHIYFYVVAITVTISVHKVGCFVSDYPGNSDLMRLMNGHKGGNRNIYFWPLDENNFIK